jgi:inorganic triphosphatase YgiF
MQSGSETEIKLVATPGMLLALRDHADLAGPEAVTSLNTTYFDTPLGELGAAGATLRVREGGKGFEQTLKLAQAGGAIVRRGEWNVPLPGEALDLTRLPAKAQAGLRALQKDNVLERVASSHIERTLRRVRFGKSAIDVAFDTGTTAAGSSGQPICELELELVEGSLVDLLALASRLPVGPDLYWSPSSKAERALALAFGSPERAVHAQATHFAKGSNAAGGFRAIAWNCLGHFLGNYRLVISSGSIEAVHQCRVAIRRFRAACSLFGKVIADDPAPGLRAELKAVATHLGELRDLDVLIIRARKAAKAAGRDAAELLARLQDRRDAAAGPVQAMLSGTPMQVLLFDLALWIETGEWHAGDRGSSAGQPLPEFAASVLAKRTQRLRRQQGPLAALTVEELHARRIEVKKLRYANEFFAGLFHGKAIETDKRRFAKALSSLQNSLGELNDLAVAAARSGNLFTGIDPIVAAGLEAQMEELLQSDGKQIKPLLKSAEKSRLKLIEARDWWKTGKGDAP